MYAYMDERYYPVLENIRTTGQLSAEDEAQLKQALNEHTEKFLKQK